MIYTASALSLATLEILVNASDWRYLPALSFASVTIPDDAHIPTLEASTLPNGWNAATGSASAQAIGDAWIQSKQSVALIVPSAILPTVDLTEVTVLLDPAHADMERLIIEPSKPFEFDARLRR